MGDYVEGNGPKRPPTCRLGSRWFFFLSFEFFFHFLTTFTDSTGTIDIRRGQWKGTTRQTGPNDLRRVVWAVGEFFFNHLSFFSFLNYIYRFYMYYRHTEGTKGGYYEANGPKRPPTCRLGSRWVFFLSLEFFSFLNYIYRFYRYYRHTEGSMGGYYEVNGPKRPPTCRLGSKWGFFFIIVFFFVTKLRLQILQVLWTYGGVNGRVLRGKRAQTTSDVSFGP